MTAEKMGRRAAMVRLAWGMAILGAPAGISIAAGSRAGSRSGRGGRDGATAAGAAAAATARIAGTGIRIRVKPLDEAAIGPGRRLAG